MQKLVEIPEELTGWDLVERLHYIGLDSRADLARVLQETDPFKARSIACCFHSAPKGRTWDIMFEPVIFQNNDNPNMVLVRQFTRGCEEG